VLDQNSFAAAVSNPIAWNSMRGEYHLSEEGRWGTFLCCDDALVIVKFGN